MKEFIEFIKAFDPIIISLGTIFGIMLFAAFATDDNRKASNTDGLGYRSGVTLFTDQITGCQYLRTSEGSITPRLNAQGKQLCSHNKTT